MSPDWTFDPEKDANDMTTEQLRSSLAASLADLKAGKYQAQETEEDESDEDESDEDIDNDEPVPVWFKIVASLVLFSPFIAAMLYVMLR